MAIVSHIWVIETVAGGCISHNCAISPPMPTLPFLRHQPDEIDRPVFYHFLKTTNR